MITYITALLKSRRPEVEPGVELELVLRLELVVVGAVPAGERHDHDRAQDVRPRPAKTFCFVDSLDIMGGRRSSPS